MPPKEDTDKTYEKPVRASKRPTIRNLDVSDLQAAELRRAQLEVKRLQLDLGKRITMNRDKLRPDSEFNKRVNSDLIKNLKSSDPDQVLLQMAASLMKEFNINAGGVMAVRKEDNRKKYRLIDILKLETFGQKRKIRQLFRSYHRKASQRYTSRLSLTKYFGHLDDLEDIIICPTEEVGVDIYIGMRDQEGRIQAIIFLDQTDDAIDLSNFRESLLRLKFDWEKIHQEAIKKFKIEEERLDSYIESLVEDIYQLLILESQNKPRNIIKYPHVTREYDLSELTGAEFDEFDFLAEYSEQDKTTLPPRTINLIKNIAMQILGLETGIFTIKDLDEITIDKIQIDIIHNLNDMQKSFLEIINVAKKHPEIAKKIIAQLLKVIIISNARNEIRKKELKDKATTDELTGLCSRGRFEDELGKEFKRSRRQKLDLALMILDLDRFKNVNDQHGHLIGDMVLKKVAECLKGELREYDTPARWGGDEYAIILPTTSREGAKTIALRISNAVKNIKIIEEKTGEPMTLSIGISFLTDKEELPDDLLQKADINAYLAKKTRRGSVFMDEEIVLP